MTTKREIASDLIEYLRENQGVCANIHVQGWIRFHDGEWQAARYLGGKDRLNSYVAGDVLDESAVLDWFVSMPVTFTPESEAFRWAPSEQTVWEDADRQDVFTDRERCFWCGESERNRSLEAYETTEDGECLLCPDCYESWAKANQIVEPVLEATA